MSSTDHEPSVTSVADSVETVDPTSTTHYSLSRAINSRRSEFVRSHSIRIKIGTWNVADCPGTDKDLASWFVDGDGLEPSLYPDLTKLNLSENSIDIDKRNSAHLTSAQSNHIEGPSDTRTEPSNDAEERTVRVVGGDKIGLYVLGLQEIVNLNLVHQSLYSDPNSVAKWQDALAAALPQGYVLVACQQLLGLLLLVYASPEVAATVSNESTISIGTGVLGFGGNKGAVVSRLLLGETTRLAFFNCHLASGHDQASLERRCWDYNKIMTQTKLPPINTLSVVEEEGDGVEVDDFSFFFGDLNFRLDGLPGDDIRHLLTLHARGEYNIGRRDIDQRLGGEGVIILHSNDDDSDGTSTPGMVSREASFDKDDSDESAELPDPDDFMPDPHEDPASLQATLDSLLPHDQLRQVIKDRKAFHEGWREGPIAFLPTYKYDVGTVGLFDSSEKKRAPSWCDRILYRTRKDFDQYVKKCQDEKDAKKKDDDMKKRGIDQAAEDENVLFDYDPTTDSSGSNLSTGDTAYDYDEYDDEGNDAEQITTEDGYVDQITLDLYTSHQRIMSSDHKPLVAMFTLKYDAIVPELKAKVHAEVVRELDRIENEGRPGITVVVDGKDSTSTNRKAATDGSGGIDFGTVGFLRIKCRSLTIANTGRVPAKFSFVEKPNNDDGDNQNVKWLNVKFIHSTNEHNEEGPRGHEISLEPGETINAIIEIEVCDLVHLRALNEGTAQLEDILVLRVTDGRDHFIPIRATWQPSCYGRSLEELIRIPRGGIAALMSQSQKTGSISYNLEVQSSSPTELFKLTEAIESLTERVIAEENMLEELSVPREKAGWPFDEHAWQTSNDDDDDATLRRAIVEALENDKPILDVLKADVPAIKRLEIVSESLLLFLRSMTDGIIPAPLWARIEQALPQIGIAKTSADIEDIKTGILDILSTAPYCHISFVFLTSMLLRVSSELLPLNKDEVEALSLRQPGTLGKRSLSFRRNAGSSANEGAIQRRLAWEKKAAEIFGVAICRTAIPANAKEKKTVEDKMRGMIEVFIRKDGP